MPFSSERVIHQAIPMCAECLTTDSTHPLKSDCKTCAELTGKIKKPRLDLVMQSEPDQLTEEIVNGLAFAKIKQTWRSIFRYLMLE